MKSAAEAVRGEQDSSSIRRLVILAMLSALGFVSMLFIKVPVVLFLKYEPKDVFLVFAGFLYGPLAALACSVITALLELFVSSTGLLGCLMNVLSSAAFACTASLIYQKRKSISGAVIGLLCSVPVMTVLMLLWNYLISPLYMGVTREEIVPMLTTVFLPFNLLKASLNAAIAILLYRPFRHVLHLCGFHVPEETGEKKSAIAVYIAAGLLICLCIAVIFKLH